MAFQPAQLSGLAPLQGVSPPAGKKHRKSKKDKYSSLTPSVDAPKRVTLKGRVGAWQDLMGTYALKEGRLVNGKPLYTCTTADGLVNFMYAASNGGVWNVTDDEEDIVGHGVR